MGLESTMFLYVLTATNSWSTQLFPLLHRIPDDGLVLSLTNEHGSSVIPPLLQSADSCFQELGLLSNKFSVWSLFLNYLMQIEHFLMYLLLNPCFCVFQLCQRLRWINMWKQRCESRVFVNLSMYSVFIYKLSGSESQAASAQKLLFFIYQFLCFGFNTSVF